MAETGIIAAITGVAAAGFRLSLVLNAVSTEIANAQFEVHAISRGVSLFSLTLKQVGTILQQNDSVHSQEALYAARAIADESKLVFDEIERTLDKVRSRRHDGTISLGQRFQWGFRRGKVQYLLALLENLKLNLSLVLQILQLGRLMAATSKSDTQDEVAMRMNAISQERMETQNIVILQYWQTNEVRHLRSVAREEEEQDKKTEIAEFEQSNQGLLTNGTPQLAIEAAPELNRIGSLIELPMRSLGDLEQHLDGIRQSPRDMLRASEEVIDPLLDRWTNWHEVRERRHARHSGSSNRFAPSVQVVGEEDDGRPFSPDFRERDESPRGYYLEGNTTNWRQPHSTAARTEYTARRKRWSGYQPSVSAESSDVDDSPGSKGSKKRSPRHHILDSGSSDSSDEERPSGPLQRRQSDGSPTSERRRTAEMPPLSHSYTAGPTMPNRMGAHPAPPFTGARQSIPQQIPSNFRPGMHHSASSPLPPINTANAPNPWAAPGPYSPNVPPPGYQGSSSAFNRYAPPGASRMPVPAPRPVSRDGNNRSPSRLNPGAPIGPRGHHRTDDEKRASREKTKKNLREGATKGLLGAGAIAGFLEALEGLSL